MSLTMFVFVREAPILCTVVATQNLPGTLPSCMENTSQSVKISNEFVVLRVPSLDLEPILIALVV